MDQKTNKSKLKTIIPIAIVIIAVIGIVIFASNKGTPGELKEKDVIGTFKITNNDNYYVEKMTLYKGGTGTGFPKNSNSGWKIEWEIVDNVLNITLAYNGGIKTGFIFEKDRIISVDGEHTYIKEM